MIIESHSLERTLEIGRRLGARLKAGDVVALIGPLGSGKTATVRGIATGAGVADPGDVNSPTFVIVNEYEVSRAGAVIRLYHIDTYRLRHSGDLENLGFEEMLEQGAVLIEWADRVEEVLPLDRLTIQLEAVDARSRRMHVSATGRRSAELLDGLTDFDTEPR